ncbi:MAG: hypothetical protein WDN26_20730 [Chitinophagaceae bacterium]
MFTTKLDDNQARFAMPLGTDLWKIFYYFIQRDGSIGVGTYYGGNSSAVVNLAESAEYTIDLNEFETQIQDFKPKKTSFHKSGTFVLKDKGGNRFS